MPTDLDATWLTCGVVVVVTSENCCTEVKSIPVVNWLLVQVVTLPLACCGCVVVQSGYTRWMLFFYSLIHLI